MKTIISSLLIVSSTLLAGDLPQLNEKPWVGWFCGYEVKAFRFGVNMDGNATLIPMSASRKGETISPRYWIGIVPVIEEVMPDGRVVTKQAQDGGWDALTESTSDAEKISYQGTVTGGARYEVSFELHRNEIRCGGKILEKGDLTKNPIRLAIRMKIPNLYIYQKDEKKLKKIVKRDRIDLVGIDGKKEKLDGFDPVNSEDVTGKGIRSARIDLDGYKGARLDVDAGDSGLFRLENQPESPLSKGFYMIWSADTEKDPESKGSFLLKFK